MYSYFSDLVFQFSQTNHQFIILFTGRVIRTTRNKFLTSNYYFGHKWTSRQSRGPRRKIYRTKHGKMMICCCKCFCCFTHSFENACVVHSCGCTRCSVQQGQEMTAKSIYMYERAINVLKPHSLFRQACFVESAYLKVCKHFQKKILYQSWPMMFLFQVRVCDTQRASSDDIRIEASVQLPSKKH